MAKGVLQVRAGCPQAMAAIALLDSAGEPFELRTDGADAPIFTREGLRIQGFSSIARRVLPKSPFYGGSPAQCAAVDQWLDTVYADVHPLAAAVWTHDNTAAADELCSYLVELQRGLAQDRFLTGVEPCAADFALLFETLPVVRLLMGTSRLNRIERFISYIRALADLPALKPLVGKIEPAAEPLRLPAPKPVAPAAKSAPAVKNTPPTIDEAETQAPRKEYTFPPTDFNFYDFKTLYVNAPNKKEALDFLWANWDPTAFSFWYLEYDKLPSECKVLFLTNNLMNGFLSRAENCRKFALGVHGVFGEEPDLHIRGVWLWRGTTMLPPLQEHDQFEVYKYRHLDLLDLSDKALIEQYWTAAEEELVEGLKLKSLKYLK